MAVWRGTTPPRVRCFRRKRRHDGLRRRSCRCSGLPERSCGREDPLGRSYGVDCLRGRARWLNNLRGHNCRYRLSAVHAELRIAGKFRAAFRAIHACHPLPDSLLLLGIVSPDVSDACNGRTMRACLHDFFTRFIPLFRNTPFDYSCIVETIPNEKRGHVLQPLRNRKREHSEVLPPMRKRAPSKRAIE